MDTDHALEIISASDLSPSKHLLLKYFIEGAVDSDIAANYLTSTLNFNPDVEPQLIRFLLDWRKLADRRTPSPSLRYILTPSYVARLRTIPSDQVKNDESYHKNLWLLTPSMHKAFRAGHVTMKLKTYRTVKRVEEKEMHRLYRLFPEDCYGLFLGDGTEWEDNILVTQISIPDMKRLPLSSPHLFEVHSRFATALHQFFVDDKISKVRFGRWLYGPTGAVSVTRVTFGLYIKQTTRSGLKKPNALKLIERYASIPAPRFVDVAENGDENYLVMTRVGGH
ncbi:hypothetical protein BOTCAL_0155g00080 [Botryotinia calthae]|uniref:Uncharacterized protein n=1 Tax=Botryotinia calthae TaxID=38488 RepID=A0A4Y8D2N0_9HELO|nr:hypothetical protein BOTCAL_0155g00080 [Botryotinia calthae]